METKLTNDSGGKGTLVAGNAAEHVGRFADSVFEPGDIVEIRRLPSRVSTWHRADEVVAEVQRLRGENANGDNVYIGANPPKRVGAKSDEGVLLARCLFADFDHTDLAEARRRCGAAALPEPTLTVNSGHGVHLYWRLAEPLANRLPPDSAATYWRPSCSKLMAGAFKPAPV